MSQGSTLGVGWGDNTVNLTACLEESSQAVSLQLHEDNGWMSVGGGSTYFATGAVCYNYYLQPWSWFGSDGFYATFGGNGNYTTQTSGTVYVSMGSNFSWSSVPGGTYSYGQGVSSGISANYAANSIGYSYSGSLPSGVGWTGGGFSGSANQVGGFGGTVYATEYGSNGTTEQIATGYGLTVNAVGPFVDQRADIARRSRPAKAGGADTFSASGGPAPSIGISAGFAACGRRDEQRSLFLVRPAPGREAFTTSLLTRRTPEARSTRIMCSPSMSRRRSRAPIRRHSTSGTLGTYRITSSGLVVPNSRDERRRGAALRA